MRPGPILSALLFCSVAMAQDPEAKPDVKEIVRRAALKINADWAADLKYACVETDETHKGGKVTSKTFEAMILDGSDYHLPLAVDGKPLPPEREKAELAKLNAELDRRKAENAHVRKRRISDWKARRDENGELLLDFASSFDFKLLREETKNGHPAYALSATPKEGAPETTRSQKVFAGMKGTAWVDRETFHAVAVDVTVFKPVPVFGMLASVLPGTTVQLGMSPVSPSSWLVTSVDMSLDVAKLHFFRSDEVTRTTYSDYRLNDQVVQELLAKAAK